MRLPLLVTCTAAWLLAGCNHNVTEPVSGDTGAAFDPLTFFEGHVQSWGVMESRSGAPTGWVTTDCQGRGDGPDRLHMVQHLSFQSDPPQDRTWTLWRTGPQQFEATANDMVGSAHAEVLGRTLHWQWVLARASGQRPFDVTMNQWMYQLDNGSVMIRTTVSKLGIVLAEVSEQFNRTANLTTASAPTL